MSIQRRDFCALAALGLASQAAFAQEWPAKQPIRIVVPYPAGGNADSSARALAEAVSGNLKQTILIDNRPGASSIIGTEAVARAPADGYTPWAWSPTRMPSTRPCPNRPRPPTSWAPRCPTTR